LDDFGVAAATWLVAWATPAWAPLTSADEERSVLPVLMLVMGTLTPAATAAALALAREASAFSRATL